MQKTPSSLLVWASPGTGDYRRTLPWSLLTSSLPSRKAEFLPTAGMEGPGKDPSWGIRGPDSHSSPAIYCLRDLGLPH